MNIENVLYWKQGYSSNKWFLMIRNETTELEVGMLVQNVFAEIDAEVWRFVIPNLFSQAPTVYMLGEMFQKADFETASQHVEKLLKDVAPVMIQQYQDQIAKLQDKLAIMTLVQKTLQTPAL